VQHVEFLGVPGSAKSTIAKEIIDLLPDAVNLEAATLNSVRRSGHDGLARFVAHTTRSGKSRLWRWAYARSTDRFSALARFIHEHPKVMQRVTKAQRRRSGRDQSQDVVLDWLLNLMARFQLAMDDPGDTKYVVIDEGFCQRAVALFGYGFDDRDSSRLGEYLAAIPRPDAVVVVETPLEVCEARLDRRGWSKRVSGLDRVARHEFLVSTAAVVDAVVAYLDTTETRVIRIDGTKPTNETARLLVDTLDS
jgi:thymidylate kinase